MQQKKTISFGFRGWMLIIYQAIAFLSFMVFTNYPMNILADMYGGAQKISTVYTVSILIGIIAQIFIARFIGKIKNVKRFSITLGIISFVLALGVIFIPPAHRVCGFSATDSKHSSLFFTAHSRSASRSVKGSRAGRAP